MSGTLARFIVEGSKRKPSGRTALYTPGFGDPLSVFTADHASDDDLIKAGKHVAKERNKRRLYGWSLLEGRIYGELNLSVEDAGDDLVIGPCKHKVVEGWPDDWGEIIDLAQELAKRAGEPVRLDPFIEVAA